MTDTIHIDSLPKRLREAAELIGVPAALLLAREYGGRRLYVPLPANCHEEHPLARLLGLDALRKLAEEWGGQEHFTIPCATNVQRVLRNAQVRAARAAGTCVSQIAQQFGMTERHVARIISAKATV